MIVVDDCSTDNSVEIVKSYAEKFGGRLSVSSLEKNSGSGAMPRNKGAMLSRGEYLFFADADDLLTKTALEEMYALAKKFDADVVYCEKYYCVNADGSRRRLITGNDNPVTEPAFEPNDLSERVQRVFQGNHHVMPWLKLVRRQLIIDKEILFPHVKIDEDSIWTYGLVFLAEKILRVPNVVYIVRQSENSMTRTERTPQQKINFWLNPVLLGLKNLDVLLGKQEFFRRNPQYRYAVLEWYILRKFSISFEYRAPFPSFVIYETIRQGFADKLGGQEVLIPALCAYADSLQRINARNLQHFQQFAAQAQARIAQLESELKRLNA